jgi:hypothetical protein
MSEIKRLAGTGAKGAAPGVHWARKFGHSPERSKVDAVRCTGVSDPHHVCALHQDARYI